MIWIFVFDLFATHPSSLEVLTSSKWCKPRCDRHGFHSSRNAFTARIAWKTRKYLSQNQVFAGGLHWPHWDPGRSQSSRARAVAKALQIISETKHHGKFRKPNGIYEEVDINGPIPKRRPKPACQGSMEHRKLCHSLTVVSPSLLHAGHSVAYQTCANPMEKGALPGIPCWHACKLQGASTNDERMQLDCTEYLESLFSCFGLNLSGKPLQTLSFRPQSRCLR